MSVDARIAELEADNERLGHEINKLVAIERALYESRGQLNEQLRAYSKLNELGLALSRNLSQDEIVKLVVQYTVYELNFERAIVLLFAGTEYRSLAFEGYFGDARPAGPLVVPADHPALATLAGRSGRLVAQLDSDDAPLRDLGRLLRLDEYAVLSLWGEQDAPIGLLVAGNTRHKVQYHSRVKEGGAMLVGVGNLASHLAATLNNARHHQELLNEREQLEQKVLARTRELSEAMEELKQLDELKTQFFSNVSHELRTPLTLILGFLNSLGQRAGQFDLALRTSLDSAQRNADQLLREINNLLDLARLEAGRMTLAAAPVDLAALLEEVASNFGLVGTDERRRLRVELPTEHPLVYLDLNKMRKVVYNLLSNAFKFTDERTGEIVVRLRSSDSEILIEVADNGIGIPAADLPHIFDRFRQVDSATTRQYQGTGIGLALVKEIVELHGGRVEVRSTPGLGSTFTLHIQRGRGHLRDDQVRDAVERSEPTSWLPHRPAEPSSLASQQVATGPADDAAEILIAEDHEDLRDYLARLLAAYRVRIARDGADALAQVAAKAPDLVISDVMMPKIDGYELCARLKADLATQDIPIVLLTAQAGQHAKLRGLDARADDYLTKPFHPEELLARVRNLLTLREQAKALRELNQDLKVQVLDQAEALQRRHHLSRFLAPSVVDAVVAGDLRRVLDRQRLLVTVLAAELCDFDELIAALEPEDITALVGRFHTVVTDCVFRERGTIVVMANGSLQAVFGAPQPLSDGESAVAAMRAARELMREIDALSQSWREIAGQELMMRGGIDLGHATVGAFGEGAWSSFSAVGGPAVRAPRLCAAAAHGRVIVTARAAKLVGDEVPLAGPTKLSIDTRTQDVWTLSEPTQPSQLTSPAVTAVVPSGRVSVTLHTDDRQQWEDLSGTTLGGRYEIERELGRGGMGVVYAAHDKLIGTHVAIKVLISAAHMESLRREAQLARLIAHPAVARVFDLQMLDCRPCLIMELVDGPALRKLLSTAAIPARQALLWARQICDGLAAAHACGIVHRDLKPDNVLVEGPDRVAIVDFGIARAAHTDEASSKVIGTPPYLAPELYQSGVADARSDIYAFGIVLLELFTGSLSRAENPAKALKTSLTTSLPRLDPTLRAIILRCIEPEVTRRFQRTVDVSAILSTLSFDPSLAEQRVALRKQ